MMQWKNLIIIIQIPTVHFILAQKYLQIIIIGLIKEFYLFWEQTRKHMHVFLQELDSGKKSIKLMDYNVADCDSASLGLVSCIKYDSNGTLIWDKNFGSDANDELTAIDFDGISSFYLTGFTEGNYKDFINRGKKDFVYMKYTDDGSEESNYQFGTEEDDELKSIIFRNSSELFVAGHTDGEYSNFNNYGGSDLILFKFGENQILE